VGRKVKGTGGTQTSTVNRNINKEGRKKEKPKVGRKKTGVPGTPLKEAVLRRTAYKDEDERLLVTTEAEEQLKPDFDDLKNQWDNYRNVWESLRFRASFNDTAIKVCEADVRRNKYSGFEYVRKYKVFMDAFEKMNTEERKKRKNRLKAFLDIQHEGLPEYHKQPEAVTA